jgi:hypothetical protein
MARILKNILGGKQKNLIYIIFFLVNLDQLITKPLPNKDPSLLPSPEDLKYKVLIRVNIFLFIIGNLISYLCLLE